MLWDFRFTLLWFRSLNMEMEIVRIGSCVRATCHLVEAADQPHQVLHGAPLQLLAVLPVHHDPGHEGVRRLHQSQTSIGVT